MAQRWMVCSACRKEIPYATKYYNCSVSTCNRSATRLVFCSVGCWDSHVAILRHRDAWAVEERSPPSPSGGAPRPVEHAAPPSPPKPVPQLEVPTTIPVPGLVNPPAPQRIIVTSERAPAPSPSSSAPLSAADESDILVVVSKMKKYIRDRSGMNASDAIAERLSDHIRALCDESIRAAAQDGRKTVLERDVPSARR